jgi:hypothetical protein
LRRSMESCSYPGSMRASTCGPRMRGRLWSKSGWKQTG